jgi:D-serine deaminase-like pyridoxal phosphate-dependent protein
VRLEELDTILVANLEAVERKSAHMQRYCDEHGLALRPRIKAYKLGRGGRTSAFELGLKWSV